MDLLVEKQCVVSGVLGVVLRISKVFGLAPLNIERVRDGRRVRVSYAANLYGRGIICLFCIMSITYLILDYNTPHHLSYHFTKTSDAVAIIAVSVSVFLSLLVATYSGFNRMQCVVTSLAQLLKINAELNQNGPSSTFKPMTLIPVCSFVLVFLGVNILYLFDLFFNKAHKYDLVKHSLQASFYMTFVFNKLLILQLTLIFAALADSLHHLNYCLRNSLLQIRNQLLDSKNPPSIHQNSYNTVFSYKSLNSVIYSLGRNGDTIDKSSEASAATINRLRTLYGAICGMVKHINSSHGMVLVALNAYFLILLVISLYGITTSLFGSSEIHIPNLVVLVLFIIVHITDIFMIIEPCHRTYEEMDRTKRLIGQLLLYTPPENHDDIHELELFYKQLMNDVVYTPMGIFYLNRTVIVTIFGSIVTYLVVIVDL